MVWKWKKATISGNGKEEENENRTVIIHRNAKTAVLFYSWICLGLYSEVLGPSLLSLMHQVSANYEQIGIVLSWRAAGLFVGSLAGGALNDRFRGHRGLFLATALTFAGLTTSMIPQCSSLAAVSTVLFLAGCTHGLHTTGGNPSLGDLWQERAAGPYNFMHAGYGLGAAIAPMLMVPFTRTFQVKDLISKASLNTSNYSNSTNSTTTLIDIVYPYGIVTGFCLLCSFLFAIFWIAEYLSLFGCPPSVVSNNSEVSDNPQAEDAGAQQLPDFSTWQERLKNHLTSRIFVMMCLTFVVFLCLVGKERVFGKFLFSYATKGQLKIPTNQAYLINTLYWVFFCLARLATAVVAFKFTIQRIFLAEMFGTLGSAVVLNSVPSSPTVFFIFSTIFGAFKSPLFPTTLGVLNRYVEVNGKLVLVVNVGSACGAMLLQYLAGYFIEAYGQSSYLYIVLSTAIVLLIVGTVLILVGRIYGDRFPSQVGPTVCTVPIKINDDNLQVDSSHITNGE